MGNVNNFIVEFAKHKLLIYFALLWGLSMFFWSLYDTGHYAFGHAETFPVLPIVYNLLELFAGLFLAIFAIMLMKPNILGAVNKEKVFLYFLILWGASLFLSGLSDILRYGQWIFQYWDDSIGLLGAIADFLGGAVLALFSWNLLSKKEPKN